MDSYDTDGDYKEELRPLDKEFDAKIARLAQKLMRDGGNDMDEATARRAARRMLEDSEARTTQASDLDPDDEDVIRRSSAETAASGEVPGARYVSDGE